MPATALITTPGSSTANAYVSLAVADQYHLDRPSVKTTWATATTDQKTAAILWATVLMDRSFEWEGSVVNTIQRLLWPRAGLADVNYWTPLDITTIPQLVQYATAEFARQLLVTDRAGDSDIEVFGITQIKTTSMRLDFRPYGIHPRTVPDVVALLIPDHWGSLKNPASLELKRT